MIASLRLYLFAGALAVLVAGLGYAHHHVYASGYAAAQAKAVRALDDAKAANAGALQTITALQNSVAECNTGRIFDRAKQTQALSARDAEAQKIERNYSTMRAKMRANEGCKSWRDAPVCGVSH